MDKTDIWSKLAAALPTGVIAWRQDGKPMQRDGKHFARFVCYIEANTVRERLDSVVPGEWDLTLELLPPLPTVDGEAACSFKARLQILGVIREDVGTGRDYKSAATDAFKRAAVRFGIAHELYAYEQNWVQVDGDSKFAKPLEDPQTAYHRRHGGGGQPAPRREVADAMSTAPAVPAALPVESAAAVSLGDDDLPNCPKCGGRMWDNRASKRNPKAPDYKCRDRSCDGVVWPLKGGAPRTAVSAGAVRDGQEGEAEVSLDSSPLGGRDDIPF